MGSRREPTIADRHRGCLVTAWALAGEFLGGWPGGEGPFLRAIEGSSPTSALWQARDQLACEIKLSAEDAIACFGLSEERMELLEMGFRELAEQVRDLM